MSTRQRLAPVLLKVPYCVYIESMQTHECIEFVLLGVLVIGRGAVAESCSLAVNHGICTAQRNVCFNVTQVDPVLSTP